MDCSLDEQDLILPLDVVTSTPKRKRKGTDKTTTRKFVCAVCKKVYEKEFYYRKHVEGHTNKAPAIDDSSKSVHLDESDLTQDVTLSRLTDGFQFQVPLPPASKKSKPSNNQPKKKPKLTLPCTYCLKVYASHKSLKSHLRSHTLEVAASRFPDVETVLAHSTEISNQALTDVTNSISVGIQGDKFRVLIGHVISLSSGDGEQWKTFSRKVCEMMLQSLRAQKFHIPSALLSSLVEQQERLVSNFEVCDGFSKMLQLDQTFEEDLTTQFMLEFSLALPKEILAFIAKTFKGNLPQRSAPLRSEPDKEDRQVIYYVAGSIIRGYVRKSRRYAKCAVWQKVVSVLKSHILCAKPSGEVELDSEWTKDVDRGSLYYITQASQEFFVKVTKVIFANEKRDGSIDYDVVLRSVGESGLCAEWDAIISESLEPDLSSKVMADVVASMCRTCGTGFAKRRLNFIRHKPVISLPTRHLVASRKNR